MPDFQVRILIRDVARGDIRGLIDEIMETHGEGFDAARGDFTIEVAEKISGNFFPIDLDAEEE